MVKFFFLSSIVFSFALVSFGQQRIQWCNDYQLSINDFASPKTNLGFVEDRLAMLHTEVKSELEEFADFCKDCKPPKKKK